MQHHIRPRLRQRRRRIAADDHPRIGRADQRAKVTANLLWVEVNRADNLHTGAGVAAAQATFADSVA